MTRTGLAGSYLGTDSVSPKHGGPHIPRPAARACLSAEAISSCSWTGEPYTYARAAPARAASML